MTIMDKLEHFKTQQIKIIELNHFFEEKKKEIMSEFESNRAELEKLYQEKINLAAKDLMKASETYRAELKAWCGVTDGEKVNVLDTVILLMKLIEMQKS